MLVKIHTTLEGKKIVAICDKELIGYKFEEDEKQLDLTGDFYKGDVKSKDEIKEILKDAYIVNLVGKKSVDLGIELGIVNKDNIIYVENIPHAEVLIEKE